jgi:catechol 2,3-dioxygenase-like lactoylglutathione lyase family enzyme
MSWILDHVNLVSHDPRRSAEFYTAVFGMREQQFPRASSAPGAISTSPDAVANFPEEGSDRLGLHLALPDTTMARQNSLWLDPIVRGHIALRVDDIQKVKVSLDAIGWDYVDMGEWIASGVYQIYVYDPDKNVLEVNQRQ